MKIISKCDIEIAPSEEYPFFRIPGVVAKGDTVFVYYECRQGGDWSVIDIAMKRSTDGGKSWSERTVIANSGGKNALNNPVFVIDGDKVIFIWMENYKRAFLKVSTDDCETWSQPREITAVFDTIRDKCPWTVIAAGPGHGMRLISGRLLVPIWMATNHTNINEHQPSFVTTLYSDDRGETWHMGDVINSDIPNLNESAIAQTSDGSVIINMRNESEKKLRAVAVSHDGATFWGTARLDENLPDPTCAGGMCNFDGGILFTNCASVDLRNNVTLRMSRDNTSTWESIEYSSLGGYSDVAYAAKHAVCVFESNKGQYIGAALIEL